MFISVSCFCCFWRICGPQCTPSFKRIRILESGKFLLVGSRIPRLWNRKYSSRIRYPTNDWNPESKCHWQRLESSTCNPESKTALDSQGRYRCYPYQDSTKSFFFLSQNASLPSLKWLTSAFPFLALAWVGSIHQGFLYILAPFVTMAADLWGCRMTSLVGGILCVAGLGASSFATRVYHLFLTYGVVFGTGACFVFITTYRAISLWFKRSDIILYLICFFTCLACVGYSYNLSFIIPVFPLKLSDKMTNSNSNNFQALWLQTLKCFKMYSWAFVC